MQLGTVEEEQAPGSLPPSTISPHAFRLTPIRSSLPPPPLDLTVIAAVTDLLVAAAHSDGAVSGREIKAVRKLAGQLLGMQTLPEWVEQRITQFDPYSFDIKETAARLASLPVEQKRYAVELARRVCDSDNAYDIEEERYMLALVLALELSKEEVSDLILEPAPGLSGPLKRGFDLLFSALFLLVAWPLLLLIGAAVKLTSPGPALFIQRRYGRNGREIRVWKFRTMRVTEDGASVQQATRADPRVTRLGAFLRRTSLDELPQFVNVLFGDMSVVGPRPHALAHNHLYRTQILEYMLRHKVKPGITGLAQVNGCRGETDTLDKMIRRVKFDLEYIRCQSLWLDLTIVARTALGGARENAY